MLFYATLLFFTPLSSKVAVFLTAQKVIKHIKNTSAQVERCHCARRKSIKCADHTKVHKVIDHLQK